MRVTSVSYGFTKNLGNFQSQRVDATVEVREGESEETALDLAVAFVHESLGETLEIEQQRLLYAYRSEVSGG